MHFQNHRKSTIQKQKQSKPCPYHSRVNSTIDSRIHNQRPTSIQNSHVTSPKQNNNSDGEQSTSLPKIGIKNRLISNDNKKNNNSKNKNNKKNSFSLGHNHARDKQRAKTEPRRLIDPQYFRYGERFKVDINYYEDLKLDNEGWPTNANIGRLYHARPTDALVKAQKKVKQIYHDQYYYIRDQLELIQKINQRFKVLKNIEQDKVKIKNMLKRVKNKKYIQTDADQSDQQQMYANKI